MAEAGSTPSAPPSRPKDLAVSGQSVVRADQAGDGLAKIALALTHPLRVRMALALVAGPASATMLSRQFGDASVGDISYHFRILKRSAVVALHHSRQVRGAQERIYQLRPCSSWGSVWGTLPPPVLSGFQNAWLREFSALAVSALDSGSTERHRQTVLQAAPVTTDEQGFGEISAALETALAIIDRIADESRGRLKGSDSADEINLVIGAAAFAAAPADRPDPMPEDSQ